ncbi:MAG: DUF4097 family beta strand repeat-containing protein [Pyrinomonadaceae bacterium]
MIRKTFMFVMFCAAALIASHAARVVRADESGEDDQFREEFHQTYPLSRGGQITLKNINGAARIVAWDRDEVKIDAVKHARSQKRLAEATIDVQAAGDTISVRTRYPTDELRWERGSNENPASVEYTLTVPRTARLDSIELINGGLDVEGLAGSIKATCINGRLSARNLTGEARLSTINGTLEAEFDRLEAGKAITLNSVNGTVDLVVPSGISADLTADTVHGTISNDFGMNVRRGEYVGSSLEGQLGGGGARVKLSNVNGAIKIRRGNG